MKLRRHKRARERLDERRRRYAAKRADPAHREPGSLNPRKGR